jgi:alpha-1,3-rhamnosyl/mannosyltransferase
MTTFCLDGRVVQEHFPGIGRYAFNLARALGPLLSKSERLVLLRDPNAPSRFDLRTLANERVTVVDVDAPIFSLRQHWRIPSLLRRLGVSVYHSPYFLMPARPGVPAIVTVHDLIPLRTADSFGLFRRAVFRAALAVALRVSSAILTPSRAAAADLRRHTASVDGRVTAIHSAVDPSFRPQPLEQVERTLANLHVPERYVLYVGSNRPHKNLPRLIEAWARVDWCDGPLVGAGPWEESVPAARERVAELRLGGRVQFLGAVSEDDLRRLYTGATLFVFPSEYEGFGFPVLEAMSCGAAVACSNAGSLAEIADGTAELFPPHDVDAMATVLTSLLADANRRSDLAQRGLQRAASLTWEATSRQVLAVYRRVAGVTPSPSSNRPT